VKNEKRTVIGYDTLLSMTLWQWMRFVAGATSLAGLPLWGVISVRDQLAELRHAMEMHKNGRHERTTMEAREALLDLETRLRIVEHTCARRLE